MGLSTRERRARLEALSGWAWDTLEVKWEEGFAHLQKFASGKATPMSRVAPGGRLPARDVGKQSGPPVPQGTLDAERRARLEALPGWTWDARASAWDDGFVHLQTFVDREGHARVPRYWREDGYRLGQWGGERWRHKRALLDKDRRRRLEALPGWTWDTGEADWDEGFASLQTFVAREGHARVPQQHKEAGVRLGGWVMTQRAAYRKGTPSTTPSGALAFGGGAGLDVAPARVRLGAGLCPPVEIRRARGTRRVSHAHREDGYPLGVWVDDQRVPTGTERSTPNVPPNWKRCWAGRGTRTSPTGRRVLPV